jgi:hypothetical protein
MTPGRYRPLRLGFVVFLCLFAATCHAEMIAGTVLSLDREEHQVMLEVATEDGGTSEVLIQTDGPLPACAEPGETMRAWGSYEDDTEQTFIANELRGPGRRFQNDPTGVRSRLHKYHRGGGSASTRPRSSRHPTIRRSRRSH